jgi:lipoprotein-anchoring transpeptidase ErfK/SrfK
MPEPRPTDPINPIQAAHDALRRGERSNARRFALQALQSEPNDEEAWLLMAAVASPRASLEYARQAQQINPSSPQARQAVEWAYGRIDRERSTTRTTVQKPPAPHSARSVVTPVTPEGLTRSRQVWLPWALAVVLLVCGLAAVSLYNPLSALSGAASAPPVAAAMIQADKLTRTPTPTATFTPTPTPTATSTPLPTATPLPSTATPAPTVTPAVQPSPAAPLVQIEPTAVKKAKKPAPPPTAVLAPPGTTVGALPPGVSLDDRWVDVDLSQQRAYAYEGHSLVRSFLVSTGTWLHPTVTGTYRIYVKYAAADMSGPGYYLPKVPYVMYFYKGYGLHGTYWHHNFGTPMSHGCVNFPTPEAGWLFSWASVGTVVNVHQ